MCFTTCDSVRMIRAVVVHEATAFAGGRCRLASQGRSYHDASVGSQWPEIVVDRRTSVRCYRS
jgi:hypothetical protein